VPFVETPVTNNRYPHAIHLVHHQPQRANGTFENRCVRHIEFVAEILEQFSRGDGLRDAFFRQVDVVPAGEQILEVPVALAVTTKY
jgi:hypothetical protein